MNGLDCDPTGSSSGTSDSQPEIWKISGGSSGGKSSPPGSPIPGTEGDCYPELSGKEDQCQSCGNKPTGQNVCILILSSVNALTRDYTTEGPGLSVKVPGGSISVSMAYKDGEWLFSPDFSGLDGLPAETGNLLQFYKYGDE